MSSKTCVKCQELASVVLRGKDNYCNTCFLTNVKHKFRSSLGKNKLFRTTERVLITVSGGSNSIVMLDMVYNAINLDSHKKLQVNPVCLHILDPTREYTNKEDLVNSTSIIMDICKTYDIPIYFIYPSEVELNNLTPNQIPDLDNDIIMKFNNSLNKVASTSRNDYLSKLRRKIFIKVAEILKCSYIFTGETNVTLANQMLSGIVIGRGDQLHSNVGFCDSRNHVKILRPMRDITFEEIKHYVAINNIGIQEEKLTNDNSLQSIIRSFVTDLQNNFQATVSTVCKTADKIGGQSNHSIVEFNKLCSVCQSTVQLQESKLTALEATNFSRLISRNPQILIDNENISNGEHKELIIPSANVVLCYGCSRTHSDFTDAKIEELFIKQ